MKVTTCDAGQGLRLRRHGQGPGPWPRGPTPSSRRSTGCVVTETWTDNRGWLAKALGGPVSGVTDRESHNRAGMEATLAKLASSVEA